METATAVLGSAATIQHEGGCTVAKFGTTRETAASTLDAFIPEFERRQRLYLGNLVGNSDTSSVAFANVDIGFNLSLSRVAPGRGNALHSHKAPERFIVVSGAFKIRHGIHGQHEEVLHPGDSVSVPPLYMRSFTNVADDDAFILTIVPGESWVQWDDQIIATARKFGAACDDDGQLLPAPLKPFASEVIVESDLDLLRARVSRARGSCRVLPSDEASGMISVSHRVLEPGESLSHALQPHQEQEQEQPSRSRSVLHFVMSGTVQLSHTQHADDGGSSEVDEYLGQWDCTIATGARAAYTLTAIAPAEVVVVESQHSPASASPLQIPRL